MDANCHMVGSKDLLHYYCHFFKQEINLFPGVGDGREGGRRVKQQEASLLIFQIGPDPKREP